MVGRHHSRPIEAQAPASIAAGGNVEHVSAHVGDVYGMEALPLKVAALDYSPVLADADLDRFVGREWLISRIEDLISSAGQQLPAGRYVLVRARAGMGKTALAAWLFQQWDCACHFTRTTGGRDTRIALQSLAAQLIVRYQMQDEFAPGGMLASWVGDPARFPKVIAAAAQRATARGEQVRLIVDGLDEADGDGPALGLPQPLPAGVGILATYREGIPPRRLPCEPRDAVHTVCIDADEPHNHADILRFLSAELREKTIAARLASAGLAEHDAIVLLAQRCNGIWVYLRYVLSQLRVDPSKPIDLDALPTGLAAYYRQQVTGRRDDPQFITHDLPVLGTLAVARQPLSRDQLSRLSGLGVAEVRRLCDVRYRPFLAIDASSKPPRYSIYHDSLREFLHGHPDLDDIVQDPVDTNDLSEAVVTAHHRIAEHYLIRFGGLYGDLDRCLPILRAHPELAESDQRYPLRHLPAHLHLAGRHHDLDTLLACREKPGAQLGSAWLEAHDRAGTLDDYLAAIALARGAAEQQTDILIAAGRPAVTLATETRYALLAANLTRSNAIPAPLLEASVRVGIWDITRALWHAHRLHDPTERAKALTTLAPYVTIDNPDEDLSADQQSPWTRTQILDHALDAARAIRLDWYRPAALAAVAVQLSEPARTHVLDQALDTALNIEDDAYQSQAFAAVTKRLTDPTQLSRAMDAALTLPYPHYLPDHHYQAKALVAIASRLKEPARSRALNTALSITSSPIVLAEVAAQLADPAKKEVLDRALNAALTLTSDALADAITQVTTLMTDQAQLGRVLDAALAITKSPLRAKALAAVAAQLTEPKRTQTLDQALDAALATEERDGKRARALLAVATQLTEPARTRVLGQALDAVFATTHPRDRRGALADVAAHLTDSAQIIRALDAALIDDDDHHRITAMAQVAAQLTESPPLNRALNAARSITPEGERANALRAIALHLTDPAQLDRALDTAYTITAHGSRARALAAIATRMAEPDRTNILGQALDAAIATTQGWEQRDALVAIVKAELSVPAQLNRAINAALAITDGKYRSDALIAVATHLAEPTRTHILEQAVLAARTIRGDRDRVKKLIAVAARLAEPARAHVLDQILDCAVNANDGSRALTLEAVADQLTEPAQLKRALNAALACTMPHWQAWALAPVAAQLAEPTRTNLLDKALNAAIAVPNERERVMGLSGVARHLTDLGQLTRALDAALAINDVDWVYAVSAVAPRLPETQRNQMLADALERAAFDTTRPGPWERQISGLAGRLTDPAQLGRALDVALGLEPDPSTGRGAWIAVFRRLTALSTDISPQDFVRLFRRASHALPSRGALFDIIGTVAPATARVGGQEALAGQLDLIT